MSARSSGRRSSQRSARLRMLSVATREADHALSVPNRPASGIGSANENVEPTPSSDSTQIRPPCCCRTFRAIDRPRPVPPPADPRPVDLVEALEDPGLVGLRDADAVVLDRHDELGALVPAADRHLAAAVAELQRVVDQVDEDLADAGLVAADRGRPSGTSMTRWSPWRSANEAQPLRGLGHDPPQVDVVEEHQRAAALDPGEVEELVDHLDEVAGLDLDLRDPVAHLGRDRVARPPRRRERASRPAG